MSWLKACWMQALSHAMCITLICQKALHRQREARQCVKSRDQMLKYLSTTPVLSVTGDAWLSMTSG